MSMRTLFLTTVYLIISFGAFAQISKDTTRNNTNPDWIVKPQEQPYNRQDNRQAVSLKKQNPEWMQHLKYGGNFMLSVFNGAYIDVSPMVGYKLNDKGTVAGLGLDMVYNNYQTINTNGQLGRTSSLDFGLNVFVQQEIFNMFFLRAELASMNAPALNFVDGGNAADPYARKWEVYPQVGLGFYPGKTRGRNSNYYIALLYNLSYPNSGYNSYGNLGGGLTLRFGYF